jgi:hypothetical protein
MESIEMNQEKIEGPYTPSTAMNNQVGAETTRALLGPGPQIRGLLGPGSQEMGASGDDASPSE